MQLCIIPGLPAHLVQELNVGTVLVASGYIASSLRLNK